MVFGGLCYHCCLICVQLPVNSSEERECFEVVTYKFIGATGG
jgi:hypothetical protein